MRPGNANWIDGTNKSSHAAASYASHPRFRLSCLRIALANDKSADRIYRHVADRITCRLFEHALRLCPSRMSASNALALFAARICRNASKCKFFRLHMYSRWLPDVYATDNGRVYDGFIASDIKSDQPLVSTA